MTSNPPPLPPNVSLNLAGSFGVCLSTTFLASALWGANVVQAFIFYTTRPSGSQPDPLSTRFLVAWLLACETSRLALVIRGLFRPLILEWGDMTRLAVNIDEFEWQNILYALVTVSSQAFFFRRIYILAQRPLWMLLLMATALLGQLAGSGAFIGTTIHFQFTEQVVHDKTGTTLIWVLVSLSLLVDVFIAGYLTFFVLTNRSGLPQTDSMITRLIVFTISTGSWTALLAVGIMITMILAPNSLIFLGLQFLTSGFYVTSVLVNLNARSWVRGDSVITNPLGSAFKGRTNQSIQLETISTGQHDAKRSHLSMS